MMASRKRSILSSTAGGTARLNKRGVRRFRFYSACFGLLISFCFLGSSRSFAQLTRPAWSWDDALTDTNRANWVDPGPFQWAWQKEAADRVAPEGAAKRPTATGDAAAFEAMVRENVVLRREVERALRQLHESRQAQASLEVQIRDLEQKRAALAVSLREVRTSDEIMAELALIRSERDALARENERLNQRLTLEQPSATSPPPVQMPPPGSDLFKKIERENLELKVELAALKQSAREAEALRAQMDRLQREQGEITERSGKEKAELQARLEQLQDGKTASEQSAERLSRQAQVAEKEAKALRARVAEIERELEMNKAPTPRTPVQPEPPVSSEARLLQAAGGVSSEADEVMAKALKLAQTGKYRDAEKLYLQALARSPNSAAIHFNLGVLYMEGLKSSASALKHFRRYLELNPRAPDADQVRAWVNELEMGLD